VRCIDFHEHYAYTVFTQAAASGFTTCSGFYTRLDITRVYFVVILVAS